MQSCENFYAFMLPLPISVPPLKKIKEKVRQSKIQSKQLNEKLRITVLGQQIN